MKNMPDLPRQPLAEVFGYPINNLSPDAECHRRLKLCPFNNKAPHCTKSRAENPIGAVSLQDIDETIE